MLGLFEQFVYLRTYSRWLPELQRRETWPETVLRYTDFIFNRKDIKIPDKTKVKITNYINNMEVLPSMRLLWSAGANAERDNISAYNCSAMAMDTLEAFGESMYLLLSGCGVGYSVEHRYISRLPVVLPQQSHTPSTFIVPDTRLGWKQAVDHGLDCWFNGYDTLFDYSKVRPAGAPLVTSGGYSSGPHALHECLDFIREAVLFAQGRQLTSLEIFDIMCEIASAVVCGGVRRSSEICLTDLDDLLMQQAKQGSFHQRRYMANISTVYREKPSVLDYGKEFMTMAQSGSGERGVFNLYSAKLKAPRRRTQEKILLCNPCGETILNDTGLCNLTEVVVRPYDDFETVRDKIKTATWLGGIQAMLTYFPHLRDNWKNHTEEERLLGVSLTGLCDNPSLITPETLRHWKQIAKRTAKEMSKLLGINMPAAITLCKPSGTSASIAGASSGIHSRWSPYYFRRVRINTQDPLFEMMVDQGMPYEVDSGSKSTSVFTFPMKSPTNSRFRVNDTALGQLEWYRMFLDNWAEQNVSCTIQVKEHEWLDTMAYMYNHFDSINGVTFFPYNNHFYKQAPFEEITEETYYKTVEQLPKIDFSRLSQYEKYDKTEGGRTLACSGGACEI